MAATPVKHDINIKGGTPKQRGLVLEAAGYYMEKLLPDHYQEVTLIIKLKKNLYKNRGLKGTCIWEDERENPREFEIEIDAMMNQQAVLLFLAHESAHVKQYVLGEMKDQASGVDVKWYGKKYNMDKVQYYDHPWEIDAYGREQGLYEMFVKTFGYRSKKWYMDTDYL